MAQNPENLRFLTHDKSANSCPIVKIFGMQLSYRMVFNMHIVYLPYFAI